jgi:multidrug efflux pump subunit AcrB
MQSLLPEDVHISYEFDQSIFVINAAKSLMTEGILGAILTGLMVLLFLRDWRSSLVSDHHHTRCRDGRCFFRNWPDKPSIS